MDAHISEAASAMSNIFICLTMALSLFLANRKINSFFQAMQDFKKDHDSKLTDIRNQVYKVDLSVEETGNVIQAFMNQPTTCTTANSNGINENLIFTHVAIPKEIAPCGRVSDCDDTDLRKVYSFKHCGIIREKGKERLVRLPNGSTLWIHNRHFKKESFTGTLRIIRAKIVVSFKSNLEEDGDVFDYQEIRATGA